MFKNGFDDQGYMWKEPIKSSVDLETVANEMVQKLKNRGINATVEEDRFEGVDCYRIFCPEGNSLTKQSSNEVFFDFVNKYEPQGIAFEKDNKLFHSLCIYLLFYPKQH